jgi:FMN phosphatase YigB (HAD superfamily)
MMRKLYISYPEDDLIEGMFDVDGTLLDAWSPNDANWRSEYLNPFMRKLGFEICDAPDWMDDKLRRYAMEWWGLTEEDVGLTKDEEGE